jgi:CheY-like chemotaxis protein
MTKKLTQPTVPNDVRLQALRKLSPVPAKPQVLGNVVSQAVATLNVQACFLHLLGDSGAFDVEAAEIQPGLDADSSTALSVQLLKRVIESGKFHLDHNLSDGFPGVPLITAGIITSYLGVPIFNSKGALHGVLGIIAGTGRILDSDDVWWLEAAAELTSVTLTNKTFEKRMSEAETYAALRSQPQQVSITAQQTSSEPSLETHKSSILVVDDDQRVNELIRGLLTSIGYQVDCAADGMEGLRMFKDGNYDLVLTDMVMPGINGWELVASLRAIAPEVPVIMITGYSSNKNGVWNEQFLRGQGVVAVLNKPFNLDLLVLTVERSLKESLQHDSGGTQTSTNPENGSHGVKATLGAA